VKLILASGSPRREVLLSQIGVEFDVEPSGAAEAIPQGAPPRELAEQLAIDKARLVASRRESGLVIGADTVVVLDGRVLGKPADGTEAGDMLRALSGREHLVITGIAVVDAGSGRVRSDAVVTGVQFVPLSEEMIARYIATGEPMDKAGAYGIQGFGALLIERIDGCYFNVVGLPLRRLAELLGEFGYDALAMRTGRNGSA
jgi:septum formation protein